MTPPVHVLSMNPRPHRVTRGHSPSHRQPATRVVRRLRWPLVRRPRPPEITVSTVQSRPWPLTDQRVAIAGATRSRSLSVFLSVFVSQHEPRPDAGATTCGASVHFSTT